MKALKTILALVLVMNITAAFAAQNDEATCDQINNNDRGQSSSESSSPSAPAASTGASSEG